MFRSVSSLYLFIFFIMELVRVAHGQKQTIMHNEQGVGHRQ